MLCVGIVYELLGTHRRRPGDPSDVDAEYEPEETIQALEAAIRFEGHEPLRLGGSHRPQPDRQYRGCRERQRETRGHRARPALARRPKGPERHGGRSDAGEQL